MDVEITKSYAVFDLKVRKIMHDIQERVVRKIALTVLSELTMINDRPIPPGHRRVNKADIGYDQVLIDLVTEIVMDELKLKEAPNNGDE